jgi:hypothetical protein
MRIIDFINIKIINTNWGSLSSMLNVAYDSRRDDKSITITMSINNTKQPSYEHGEDLFAMIQSP